MLNPSLSAGLTNQQPPAGGSDAAPSFTALAIRQRQQHTGGPILVNRASFFSSYRLDFFNLQILYYLPQIIHAS